MSDTEKLVSLAKDALNALDKFSQAPHYFVQPGLSIIKKHMEIIQKFKLMGTTPLEPSVEAKIEKKRCCEDPFLVCKNCGSWLDE